MKKNNKGVKKEHDVETPSPPQVMDPSASPGKQLPKDEKARKDTTKDNPSKKRSKEEDRKLTPNEEL
jgi:hypothetical protein